jgi:tetratricopeptide (TPR) repeat protein
MSKAKVFADLRNEVLAAQELLKTDQHAAAQEAYLRVYGAAKRIGIRTPEVCLQSSIACDYAARDALSAGDCDQAVSHFENALRLVAEACELDPLNPQAARSNLVIRNVVVAALKSSKLKEDLASGVKVWEALRATGDIDAETHVIGAELAAATGATDKALAVMEAVCTLNPSDQAAWKVYRRIAEDAGDKVLADRCAARIGEMGGPLHLLLGGTGGAEA